MSDNCKHPKESMGILYGGPICDNCGEDRPDHLPKESYEWALGIHDRWKAKEEAEWRAGLKDRKLCLMYVEAQVLLKIVRMAAHDVRKVNPKSKVMPCIKKIIKDLKEIV